MALPHAVPEIVGAEDGAGHGGDHALRQEESEDVVAGGAIDLGEGVGAGQKGGAREADAGRGGIDLFLGNANGRIVLEGAFDGLGDGQGCGVGCCAAAWCEGGHGEGQKPGTDGTFSSFHHVTRLP